MKSTVRISALALLASCGVLFLPACAGEPEAASVVEEVDSVGIPIMTSREPLWSGADGWTISPEPELSLGSVDGGGPEDFGTIVAVKRTQEGHVVVADGDAREIHIFSEAGDHLGGFGGEGDGPGEFQSISSLQLVPPDTVVVFDRGTQRLTRFLLSGRFVGSQQLGGVSFDGAPPLFDRVLQLEDGALVGREGRDFVRTDQELARDTVHFLLVRDSVHELDAVPGLRTVQADYQGRRLFGIQAFNQVPIWGIHQQGVVVGEGGPFSVRVLGMDGLRRILRRRELRPALTESDIEAFVEMAVERVPSDQRDEARRVHGLMSYPANRAAYQSLLVDPDGYAWLERYGELPGQPGPEWDVYDLERGFLEIVPTPEGLRIQDVGNGRVVGVWEDSFGVEHVRVHRLNR